MNCILAFSVVLLSFGATCQAAEDSRPIIGVLTQELTVSLEKQYHYASSYVAASYVKLLEMGGARVVPIFVDESKEYYEEIFNSTNGLLIPGGAIYLNNITNSSYGRAAKMLYDMAVQAEDTYPILGVCLGAEALSILLDANDTYRLVDCSASNVSLSTEIVKGADKTSRLFRNLPADIFTSLTTSKVTANFHRRCLLPEAVTNTTLKDAINILSVSKDKNGTTFVATYEAKRYPFYGLQWHPEKNPFEWNPHLDIPHSEEAVRVSQYFANFFVNQARKNARSFFNETLEERNLIYNCKPQIPKKSEFTQVYLMKNYTIGKPIGC